MIELVLNGLLKGLKELIYPEICLACKNKLCPAERGKFVCSVCWHKIQKNSPPFCVSCGRTLAKNNLAKNICPACLKKELYFDRAFSPCAYTGVIKELIHQFKYAGKDYLGKPLGSIMNNFIREYNLPIDYLDFIVPVPLHASRRREREFNQAQVLSGHIAETFKKEVLSDALVRCRKTKTQTSLMPQDRFNNVKESFLVRDAQKIKAKNLLLVDDVLTTGATSSEAAKALKNAGANIVLVITLAN